MKTFFLLLLVAIPISVLAQTVDNVVLGWEADTYTPPFYQGHSLPSPASSVRIWALVHDRAGKPLSPAAFNFEWSKDNRNITSASGPGKNTLTYIAGSGGEASQIKVQVAGRERTITIPVVEPRLVIYEDEPLAGANFARALGERVALRQPEITLRAEPYYFSQSDWRAGRIEFDWRLNGRALITDPGAPRLVTFVAPSQGSGDNTVELTARNTERVLQAARRVFSIAFGEREFSF